MYSHLSYSLAQQHNDDLRAVADRRRLLVEAASDRPAPTQRLARIVRRQRRAWGRSSAVTASSRTA